MIITIWKFGIGVFGKRIFNKYASHKAFISWGDWGITLIKKDTTLAEEELHSKE